MRKHDAAPVKPANRGQQASVGALICEAIRRRALLRFEYHGAGRIVAPYCHGVSARGGEVADDPDYNPDDRGMKQIHCRI